jgi:hypothetical protein
LRPVTAVSHDAGGGICGAILTAIVGVIVNKMVGGHSGGA